MTEPAAPDIVLAPNTKWADELAEQAKAMWKAGLSARNIGDAIGRTRNGVIGKLHRMGLRRHQKEPLARSTVVQHQATQRYKQHKREPWSDVVEIKPEITPTAVGIVDLERHHCRWPVDGEGAAMLYCGGQAVNGYPYCSRHARMAYSRPGSRA